MNPRSMGKCSRKFKPVPKEINMSPFNLTNQLTCAIFALLAIASPANAQLSPNQLPTSQWDTTYVAANGQRINSTLTFNGRTGTYTTPAGLGRLSQIEYKIDFGVAQPGGNRFNVYVSGIWQLGNSSGRFYFTGSNITQPRLLLNGRWGFGADSGSGGTWDASYRGQNPRPGSNCNGPKPYPGNGSQPYPGNGPQPYNPNR